MIMVVTRLEIEILQVWAQKNQSIKMLFRLTVSPRAMKHDISRFKSKRLQ